MVTPRAPVAAQGRPVHIGRQPIYDAGGGLHGYELLFRAERSSTAALVGDDAGDLATTSTILAAFSGFGAGELLGGLPGFVNLTRAFLVGDLPVPFEPDQAVLEVLETVELDPVVLAGVRHLIDSGYRVALDDFVWTPAADELVGLATIVKIDVLTPWEQVLTTVRECRQLCGDGQVLLAERVEDADMLQRCRDLGFSLFQGYHLGRPQTLTAETLSSDRLTVLQILARLSGNTVQLGDIEGILRTDPALVLQLLRLANSSSHGLTREIASVTDAAVLLGLNRLRAWVLLLSMSSLSGEPGHAAPALLRASTCEHLARASGRAEPEAAFTVGLLHGLAGLLGVTPQTLLNGLPPLQPHLVAALGSPGSPLGRILAAVVAYDTDDGAAVQSLGFRVGAVAECYLDALSWTTRTMSVAAGAA